MAENKNIILFDCKRRINRKLPKNLIDDSQKIFITKDVEELNRILNESELAVIVYDREQIEYFINLVEKFCVSKNFYAVIILTRNKASKFNFKNHQNNKNIIYISKPSNIEELSQFLNFIFKIEFLEMQMNEKEKIIEAFERASELSRKELLDKTKSLSAWEAVFELAKKEKSDYNKELTALERILELSREERVLADKIISAWERTFELGKNELLECYNKLNDISTAKKEIIENILKKLSKSSQISE